MLNISTEIIVKLSLTELVNWSSLAERIANFIHDNLGKVKLEIVDMRKLQTCKFLTQSPSEISVMYTGEHFSSGFNKLLKTIY